MRKSSLIVLLTATLFVSGCAAFTESLIAIPGTVVDAAGSIGSSIWHLATDWITGDYAVNAVVEVPVVEPTTVEVVE